MLARHAHANHSVASRSHSIHFMRSTLASKRAANASFPPRMPRMHAAASTDAQVEDNEKDNTAVHTTESSKEVDINPSVYDDMMDGQSEDYQIDWRKKWCAKTTIWVLAIFFEICRVFKKPHVVWLIF